MPAVGRRALGHRGDEVRFAPLADAVVRIGRDVRHVERAERRFEPQPAAELRLVVLPRRRVARRAAAGVEHLLAVREIRCVAPERARRHRRRNGDEPEHRKTDDSAGNDEQGELAQHRASLWRPLYAVAVQPEKPKGGASKRPPSQQLKSAGQLFFAL